MKTSTYILVHGAWQTSYVWDTGRSDLMEQDHQVIAVELPGHGTDITPPYALSLDIYRDKVIEAISAVNGQVILVGHSMAGMVISHVAEKVPSNIPKLVYIGAFLPASGRSLTDLAYSDPDSKLGSALIPSSDRLTLDVASHALLGLFIQDGSPSEQDRVLAKYRGEPAISFTNKVMLTSEGFGSVEKVYIKTLNDFVISPGLQDRMIAAAGIETIHELETSHSPFLAQPHAVADLFLKIGERSELQHVN